MKYLSHILFCVVALLLFAACDEQRDRNGILSEKAMVDVLYDYQLALALANEEAHDGNLAEIEYRYTQGVMKKHGLTDDEFNLSLAHYARDPKQMLGITEKVSARLTGEIDGDAKNVASSASVGRDTVIVWENRPGFVLTANSANHVHLEMPIANMKRSDRMIFTFQSDWYCREGQKSAGVMLTAVFDNDSTATVTEIIREYNRDVSVSLFVPESRKLKSFDVDIYQSSSWMKFPQVLSVSNLALWGITVKR